MPKQISIERAAVNSMPTRHQRALGIAVAACACPVLQTGIVGFLQWAERLK